MPVFFHSIEGVMKFLLPTIISVVVSLMSYFVARNQRTIAYNKYNLDLFDKRFEAYQEFLTEFHASMDILNKHKGNINYFPDFTSMFMPLLKCSILFPRYYENGIDGDLYLQQDHMAKRTVRVAEVDFMQNELSRFLVGSESYKSTIKTIAETNHEIKNMNVKTVEMCNNSIDYMRSHLNISHRPY